MQQNLPTLEAMTIPQAAMGSTNSVLPALMRVILSLTNFHVSCEISATCITLELGEAAFSRNGPVRRTTSKRVLATARLR